MSEIQKTQKIYIDLKKRWTTQTSNCPCHRPCHATTYIDQRATELSSSDGGLVLSFGLAASGHKQLHEFKSYTFMQFLSQVGGSMGLFAGLSLLSVAVGIINGIITAISKIFRNTTLNNNFISYLKSAFTLLFWFFFLYQAMELVKKYNSKSTATAYGVIFDDRQVDLAVTVCLYEEPYIPPEEHWLLSCQIYNENCMEPEGNMYRWTTTSLIDREKRRQCHTIEIKENSKAGLRNYRLHLETNSYWLGYIDIHDRIEDTIRYPSILSTKPVDLLSTIDILVSLEESVNLPSAQNPCNESRHYSQTQNIQECLDFYLQKRFGCFTSFMEKIITNKTCTEDEETMIIDESYAATDMCNYPMPCTTRKYHIDYSNEFRGINENVITVIQFITSSSQRYTAYYDYTFSLFWSELGGFLGMFVGASILSILKLVADKVNRWVRVLKSLVVKII